LKSLKFIWMYFFIWIIKQLSESFFRYSIKFSYTLFPSSKKSIKLSIYSSLSSSSVLSLLITWHKNFVYPSSQRSFLMNFYCFSLSLKLAKFLKIETDYFRISFNVLGSVKILIKFSTIFLNSCTFYSLIRTNRAINLSASSLWTLSIISSSIKFVSKDLYFVHWVSVFSNTAI